MKPLLFAPIVALAAAAVAAGCYDVSNPNQELLVVEPILDSMFVGETRPPRSVFLIDANGNKRDPGPVTWEISPTSVATIDAGTGTITGVSKGEAVVLAQAAGVTSPALVIVSRPLDMTLLMDTVYLMPSDTFTIPLAIQQQTTTSARTVSFDPSPQTDVYTINTTTGLVTAHNPGTIPYVAHVTDGTNTVTDAGAVVVMTLGDIVGGKFFMTIVGTAIRHNGGVARAMNYTKLGGTQAFRLTDSLFNSAFDEKLYLTLPDPVLDAGTFDIDSLNPQEASVAIGTLNPFCNPRRPWAVWSSIRPSGIRAFSHLTDGNLHAGQLVITQHAPLTGGAAISGRFKFTAQRSDLYFDTLGVLTIQGTFVAPLVENTTICQ